MKTLSFFSSAVLALLILTGCSVKTEQKPYISKANLQKTEWKNIEGFDTDNLDEAFKVFQKDCQSAKKYDNLNEICIKALDINDSKNFFESNFIPFKLIGDDGEQEGLITGYYEPLLQGNKFRTDRYKYPIYSVPSDLITVDLSEVYPELESYRLRGRLVGDKVLPYKTRQEIEDVKNRYDKYLKPICYVDDKVDLFFLHIQGSGKVELPNGKILNIGYAQQNGRKYYAIGKKLIEIGALSKAEVSLQSIKKWLHENPERLDEILNLNDSYVFFRQSEKTATGSLGTELVANRNIAVDRRYIPLGYPVFINTTNPVDGRAINRLVIAADTGGAIKGEIRADYYFGNGKLAEELAGKMKQRGTLYLMVPKNLEQKKDD